MTPSPYPVIEVTAWDVVDTEGSGGDEKEWLEDADEVRWLYKPRTEHVDWAQGEDWAEKVVGEIARRLGVPAARTELSTRRGRRGSVSRSLRPPGWELQHGSLLLKEHLPEFTARTKVRTGHTLANIEAVLRDVAPPAGYEDLTSFEVFAGFLVLDALVANQDRHEENWAVIRPLPGSGAVTLTGSYDHGSSLAFNLKDARRRLELDRGGVHSYATRARAQRFESGSDGELTLVELAGQALSRCSPAARQRWLDAVNGATVDELAGFVDRVPEMSEVARIFTSELLSVNRGRLLDEHLRA